MTKPNYQQKIINLQTSQNDLISQENFKLKLDQAKCALEQLACDHKAGRIELFNHLEQELDLRQIQQIANKIQDNFKQLIIFAIGGPSLCGKSIISLGSNHKYITIKYIDYIDQYDFEQLLYNIDIKQTAFLVISKSGNTVEILSQLLLSIDFFKDKVLRLADHFFFITEDADNPLRLIAKDLGSQIISCPKNIGGRYGCFSEIVILPALLAGIDIELLRASALNTLVNSLNMQDTLVAEGTAMANLMVDKSINNFVIIPYIRRLKHFTEWYAQIWSESLGKEGHGTTPIRALGSIDQHSQLQLYLDGPKDKFFTFITLDKPSSNLLFNTDLSNKYDLTYLQNNSLHDVVKAAADSSIASIAKRYAPIRNISLSEMTISSLGAIKMHFILETLLTAYILNINPYDQPAVEEGKINAKEQLARKQI